MKVLKYTVPDDFNLFLGSDTHTGSLNSHEDGIKIFIDAINSKYDGLSQKKNRVAMHGDCIEGITIDDPRYIDQTNKEGAILRQMADAIKDRQHMGKALLFELEGNHPLKLWKFGRVTEKICKDVNCDYGTLSAVIKYVDKRGKLMFRQYAYHGAKAFNSTIDDPKDRKNAMLRSLRKALQRKVSHCLLMTQGHAHTLLTYSPEEKLSIGDNGITAKQGFTTTDPIANFIPEDRRWYCCVGGFYKSLGNANVVSYAELKGYDPVIMGYSVARIRNRKLVGIDEVVV